MLNLFPLIKPFIFLQDPEKAHDFTIKALKAGLSPVMFRGQDSRILRTKVFDLEFDNPVGLAAGFDKNADVMTAMLNLGFGFVEAGTVTPFPQPGNPKPRLFRLQRDQAVINRFGFNNKGLSPFKEKLEDFQKIKTSQAIRGVVGANIGANKTSEDRTADYVTCIERLYGFSDYFTVNISSPNTPGLRALQSKSALEDLVYQVLEARKEAMKIQNIKVPILIKIAPDLTDQDKEDIAAVTLEADIDGLIVTNTTVDRYDSLRSRHKSESGGLSGKPVFSQSTQVLWDIYHLTHGQKPLIGVGGISSGLDAYKKIRAGASLVQLYSMLVFKGPALVTNIKKDLAKYLKADGFSSVSEAVGADHR